MQTCVHADMHDTRSQSRAATDCNSILNLELILAEEFTRSAY